MIFCFVGPKPSNKTTPLLAMAMAAAYSSGPAHTWTVLWRRTSDFADVSRARKGRPGTMDIDEDVDGYGH